MSSGEALATSSLSLRPASVGPPPATSGPDQRPQHAVRGGGRAPRGLRGGRSRETLRGRGARHQGLEVDRTADASNNAARRGGQGRGRHRGGQERAVSAAVPPPAAESSQISTSNLRADAPSFQPTNAQTPRQPPGRRGRAGHQHPSPRRPNVPAQNRARRPSLLKSNAPDIAGRTHDDISNGIYECPICTAEVTSKSKVWSCKTCWTVFHLKCIETWSKNEGSSIARRPAEDDSLPPARQWRCPGCNLPKDVLPSQYTCWCEKEIDPTSTPGLPPHSCGQTCGKTRPAPLRCPHPCDLLCHAGPCQRCPHMGPVQSCFCGKKMASRKCIETDYDSGWSCGEDCGDLMPCGEHFCERPCHEGLCGACEVDMDARCYCGKVSKSLPCHERCDGGTSKQTIEDDKMTEWMGLFDCGSVCERLFDCGKHRCQKRCHAQDAQTAQCPKSPEKITTCPCGKTALSELLSEPRKSCEDSIPNCVRQCAKSLSCGHPCQKSCHLGECPPCLLKMEISCLCGRTKTSTMCHQGAEERPQCMRVCRANMNCGRHECGERCCSGERKAAERQATKRKLRPLGAAPMVNDGFEAEHICTRVCGRLLKCGNHTCPELCHRGACNSCREAIFEEISCHCGRTILHPPLPCGTTAPSCDFQCERPKQCGHPRVTHSCHGNDESCPKCPFLEQKECLCRRHVVKNQPCWLNDVRCGDVCGKQLKCGSHYCRKQCHRTGECEDAGKPCQQACGKSKKACGHPCEDQCHAPSACKEDKPCPNKTFITCECQNLKQEVKCAATRSSEGNSQKSIPCDDECAKLARNQQLAKALNIDPDTHQNDHIPYSNETLKAYRENTKWGQEQEREFRVFAADESAKRLRFKPMPSRQRAFLHSLSEDFGFDSESMDPDPHRHVAIFKTPRFVMAPMKTLAECVRIRMAAQSTSSTAPTSTAQPTSVALKSKNEPYNAILLSSLRFGLTLDEVRHAFQPHTSGFPGLNFEYAFLPSEEIVLKARPVATPSMISEAAIETSLKSLKAPLLLASSLQSPPLASRVQLCALDSSLNVLRRESDGDVAGVVGAGGWSQVAAKAAAAPRAAPSARDLTGGKNAYTVLGSRVKEKTEKPKATKAVPAEKVVDDWEEEVRKEEEENVQEAPRSLNDEEASIPLEGPKTPIAE